jgi:hypothetical protein
VKKFKLGTTKQTIGIQETFRITDDQEDQRIQQKSPGINRGFFFVPSKKLRPTSSSAKKQPSSPLPSWWRSSMVYRRIILNIGYSGDGARWYGGSAASWCVLCIA